MESIDISALSYENFLEFVFNTVTENKTDDSTWRDDLADSLSNPAQLLQHFSRLCREFESVATRYSPGQIDQGFWLLLGSQIKIPEVLSDPTIPIDLRKSCILSMCRPYIDVLVNRPDICSATNCFYMWFDLVGKGFWYPVSSRVYPTPVSEMMRALENPAETIEAMSAFVEIDPGDRPAVDAAITKWDSLFTPRPEPTVNDLNADERIIHDAIYETLHELLSIDSWALQSVALHGLGHLRHPSGTALVQKFLDTKTKGLSAEQIEWIEQCRNGTVM